MSVEPIKYQPIVPDAPTAKSEGVQQNIKQAGTQQTYSPEASRAQTENIPPSQVFKGDKYNPGSTILEGKEIDQREAKDQRVNNKKDREKKKGDKFDPKRVRFPTTKRSPLDMLKYVLRVKGIIISKDMNEILNKLDDNEINDLLKQVNKMDNRSVELYIGKLSKR